jgi:tetratricopeptide (TPR) repeat protein
MEFGKALRRMGEWQRADQAFIQAAALRPDLPEALIERARLKWSQGDVEMAEELLTEARGRYPAEPLSAVLLARLLVQRDALAAAAEVIEEAARSCPRDPMLLLAQGEVLLHRQDFVAASTCFLHAQEAGASAGASRAGLSRVALAEGNQALAQGRLTEAAFLFKRAADLNTRAADPLSQLGLVLAQLGNRRRGAQHLRRAAALQPSSAEVHYRLGCVLRDAGDVAGAAQALDRALRRNPLHLQARRALADLLAEREPGRALLLYAEELARTPSDATLWLNLGRVCLRIGDRRQAARCFAEARRLGSTEAPGPEPGAQREEAPRRVRRRNPGRGRLSKKA